MVHHPFKRRHWIKRALFGGNLIRSVAVKPTAPRIYYPQGVVLPVGDLDKSLNDVSVGCGHIFIKRGRNLDNGVTLQNILHPITWLRQEKDAVDPVQEVVTRDDADLSHRNCAKMLECSHRNDRLDPWRSCGSAQELRVTVNEVHERQPNCAKMLECLIGLGGAAQRKNCV